MTTSNLSADDLESLTAAKKAFKSGNTNDDVIQFYKEWVKDGKYMKDTEPQRYRAHILACENVEKFFPEDRSKVRVIDIGAGTGRAGEELVKKGFKLLDALEPCTDMINVAKQLGIYQNFIEEPIGNRRLPIENDTYDLGIVAGAMGEGHIPCEALHEMTRIVKPGGLISMSMREEFLTTCTDYNGRLEPLMKEMEQNGEWKLVSRDIRPDYYLGKSGVVYKFSPC